MRTWLIDILPLKIYPEYRRLWFGASLSAIGNHITVFAATLQIFPIPDIFWQTAIIGGLLNFLFVGKKK